LFRFIALPSAYII